MDKRDLVIYGVGKIGEAIKTLAENSRETNLHFNSDIYTIDIAEDKGQFSSVYDIKDMADPLIHIIAIDTGIITTQEAPGFKPDTFKITQLIEQIIEARGEENPYGDKIIIESTVEIGFYKNLKETLGESSAMWEIIYSPERYNEDTTTPDGFVMDPNKLVGIDVIDADSPEEEFLNVKDGIENYIAIFENYSLICAPIHEVEASKVIENTLRFIKLSFVNELNATLPPELDRETINALVATKDGNEDFDGMKAGLIGGGCIPVDPLYLPNVESTMVQAIFKNDAARFQRNIDNAFKMIIGSRITNIMFMGVSYKPNSTSLKNSRYMTFLKALSAKLEKVNEAEKLAWESKGSEGDAPKEIKIWTIDHLSVGTRDDQMTKEVLQNVELIIVGANHEYEESDYLSKAIASGTNVFDLNGLGIYKRKDI